MKVLNLLAALYTIAFLTSCSAKPAREAYIVEYGVACNPCQKYNSDLKSEPDKLSLCVCE